jgi:hypothetical protein
VPVGKERTKRNDKIEPWKEEDKGRERKKHTVRNDTKIKKDIKFSIARCRSKTEFILSVFHSPGRMVTMVGNTRIIDDGV